MKLLVADDEALARKTLQHLATRSGYNVVVANDGREALAQLATDEPPSIVLLDWLMPDLDGLDVCRAIRERTGDYIYVILVTVRGKPRNVVEGLAAGADDFITKPFDPDELAARLNTGRRIVESERQLRATVSRLSSALAEVKQLQGIIPICMHCRRLRAKNDDWQRLEAYIEAHTDAHFSHGVCEECLDVHYPDPDQQATDGKGLPGRPNK